MNWLLGGIGGLASSYALNKWAYSIEQGEVMHNLKEIS